MLHSRSRPGRLESHAWQVSIPVFAAVYFVRFMWLFCFGFKASLANGGGASLRRGMEHFLHE